MADKFTLNSNAGYGTYQGRYLQLDCTQEKDATTNKSTIKWTLTSLGGTSNYYTISPTTVTINGVQVYYKPETSWKSYAFPAAKGNVSGSIVIDHNTDGSKSINVSLTTGVWYGQTSSFSGVWTLDSIPRQAKITAAYDFTDGDNPRISFSNPGGFPIDVWLEPNPVGEHRCVRQDIPNTGSYTWELKPEEWEELRNSCAGNDCTIRIGIYTIIGGTIYHDFQDRKFIMTENDATKPSVSMSIDLNNGSLPSTFDGMYIQGKSKVDVQLSAKEKYGAKIESYSALIDRKTYRSQAFTSDVVQQSGSVEIVGYAKDSRGFTGSVNETIEVTEYSKPLVIPLGDENAVQCYRSDGNGKRVGNSTSVWIKAKRSYYELGGKNTCSLQWRRKLVSEEWKDDWEDLGTTGEYNGLLPDEVFELKEAYAVQIRAIDTIGEFDIKTFEIPTQDVALHLGKGGKNVAVGTYCDYSKDYTFHSEWDATFDKSINGMYIQTVQTDNGNDIRLQTCFDDWNDDGSSQQSFFVFGNIDAYAALGACVVQDTGQITEDSITNITADVESKGVVLLRMEYDLSGWLVIMSPRPFSIL